MLDGYTITECDKAGVGTDVILHIKPDTEDEKYERVSGGVPHPVSGEKVLRLYPLPHQDGCCTSPAMKPRPEDAGDDYKPEWEDYTEWATLNSMVPIWQKRKDEVTEEEYANFYQDKFDDYEDPAGRHQGERRGHRHL